MGPKRWQDRTEMPAPAHQERRFWYGDFNPYDDPSGAPGRDPYYGALGYRDRDAREEQLPIGQRPGEIISREAHSGRVTTTYRLVRRPRISRGPKGYQRSDERIQEDIVDRLSWRDDVDSREITVQVESGRVKLTGFVPVRYMRYLIEDAVAATPGVQDIDNAIRVHR